MERVRRRWWTAAVTLVAGVLVLGALLTGVFQVVMLMAPGYRQDLSDYVSRVARQPVEIGGVGLGWRGLAPRLDLTDITLYGEDGNSPALIAERLRLGFGLMRLLRGDTTPQRVELSGLALFVRIDAEGRFSLRGLDTGGGPARARQDWLRQLGRFESVRLTRCELRLDDARLPAPDPRIRLREAEIRFADGRGRATAELLLPPNMGGAIQVDAQVQGDLQEPDTWSGRWTVEVDDLRSFPWLQPLLAEGTEVGFEGTALRLDGRLQSGTLSSIDVGLEAGRLRGQRAEQQAEVRNLYLQALFSPDARGWAMDIGAVRMDGVQGPWPETRARVLLQRESDGARRLQADADYLGLGDLAPWVGLLRGVDPDLGVALAGVAGKARGLVLRGYLPADAGAARYSLRTELDGVGIAAHAQRPGVAGLSGRLSASETGGRLLLQQVPLTIEAPSAFASPLTLENVDAELQWTRRDKGWDVQADSLALQSLGAEARGALKLRLPDAGAGTPEIDLDLRLAAADVTRLKPYAPQFWRPSLRSWIDRAVVGGRITEGRVQVQGRLRDFPFVDDGPGRFAVDLDGAGVVLAFAPGWPALRDLSGQLQIRGRTLVATADGGTIMDNRIDSGEARIEDFSVPELSVRGQAQGEIARFYDFVQDSPLAPRLERLLSRTTVRGDSVVQVKLDVPLREIQRTQARGQVRLRDVQLEIAGLPEPVTGLYGDVLFDNRGAEASELHGEMFGTQVLASIRRDAERRMRVLAHFDFKPDIDGRGLSRLLPRFLRTGLRGATRFTAEVPLSGATPGQVLLRSDLAGLHLDLPQPLHKPAADRWPTTLQLNSDTDQSLRLALQIPGRLGGELTFARPGDAGLQLERARFRAGGGALPERSARGISIVGRVSELEPLRWAAAFSSGRGPTSSTAAGATPALPLDVELEVGRLWLGRLSSDGLRVQHRPEGQGWVTQFNGAGAQGRLQFRPDLDGGSLEGRLERAQIAWKPRDGATPPDANGAPRTTATHPPTDPARLPRLDLRIDDLRIGSAELGALEMRTTRVEGGQQLESLRSAGPDGRIEAQGRWQRVDARSSAQLQFSFDSTAVDDVLVGMGYARSISAGNSRVTAELEWPQDAPTAIQGLNWALGRGELRLDMKDGVLRAVEPGAGRVLGLINFWAIPRRLSLNFGDVLAKGLSFDRMQGRFRIAEGVADTDDLDLDAPSLNMEVRGRVGLLARDYDQRVKVVPDVSAGVTLGALLLGGPAAGVLALIAQEVLDQPLDQVGQLHYHLTGSWDDPRVERVGGIGQPPAETPAGRRPFNPGGTQ